MVKLSPLVLAVVIDRVLAHKSEVAVQAFDQGIPPLFLGLRNDPLIGQFLDVAFRTIEQVGQLFDRVGQLVQPLAHSHSPPRPGVVAYPRSAPVGMAFWP